MVVLQRDQDAWATLLVEVEAGGWADFTPQAAAGERPTIKAAHLSDLLLGRPVQVGGGKRVVPIPATGLRIKGAVIDGPLDLDEAAQPDGSPLPPIIFENCILLSVVRLSRGRLRHLCLADSKITHVQAQDVEVLGPVNLAGVTSAQSDDSGDGEGGAGLCWVELRGARISGSVSCAGARFVAPPRRKDFDPVFVQARFALDLWNATISGSLTLTPNVFARGGVSIQLARIGGEVWCDGAELIGIEGNALNADEARIGGSLYGRAAMPLGEESRRFRATGGVSIYSSRIGGSLVMDGATVKHGELTSIYYALDAKGAVIEGIVSLGALTARSAGAKTDTERFEAMGCVSFASATIAGEFVAIGARLNSAGQAVALDLVGVRIGGHADFDVHGGRRNAVAEAYPFEATGTVSLFGATIGGSLIMRGASLAARSQANSGGAREAALIAENVRIGLHAELCATTAVVGDRNQIIRFSCDGQLSLFGAQIASQLIMNGANLRGVRGALLAQSAQMGQLFARVFVSEENGEKRVCRFEATGGVSFEGARVEQSMHLSGAWLTQGEEGIALNAREIEIGGTLTLSADLEALAEDGQPLTFKAIGRTDLSRARIGGDLSASGAIFSAPNAVAFLARQLRIGRDVTLNHFSHEVSGIPVWLRFVAEGAVDFSAAEIAGILSLTGARLDAKGTQYAFSAVDATIGEVRFDSVERLWEGEPTRFRFEALGGVYLDNAKIARHLNLSGALLKSRGTETVNTGPSAPEPLGFALRAERLEVGGHAALGKIDINEGGEKRILPVDADGPVNLSSARIGSDLIIQMRGEGAWRFDLVQVGGRTSVRSDFSDAVTFREAALGASLSVHPMTLTARTEKVPAKLPARPPSVIDLHGARVGTLDDGGGSSWGPTARFILDGFRYDRLSELRPKWRARRAWLRRQGQPGQPVEDHLNAYEQLARALVAGGHVATARRISFARKDLERKLAPIGLDKALRSLHGVMVGYGFFPERAIVWFAAYWFVVAVLVQIASTGRLEMTIPGSAAGNAPIVLIDTRQPSAFVLPPPPDATGVLARSTEPACSPSIRAEQYALDVILGPVDLGEEKRCAVSQLPQMQGWRVFFAFVSILGWVASIAAPFLLPMILGTLGRRFAD